MTDDELWFWHAYQYGWRRVYLHAKDDDLPLDREKRWFNSALVEAAEGMYARITGRDRPRAPDPYALRYREAAEARERFAKERGFHDFAQVIAYGIQRAGRIPVGGSPRSAATDDRPKPIYVDVPPAELLARFGGYATESEAE